MQSHCDWPCLPAPAAGNAHPSSRLYTLHSCSHQNQQMLIAICSCQHPRSRPCLCHSALTSRPHLKQQGAIFAAILAASSSSLFASQCSIAPTTLGTDSSSEAPMLSTGLTFLPAPQCPPAQTTFGAQGHYTQPPGAPLTPALPIHLPGNRLPAQGLHSGTAKHSFGSEGGGQQQSSRRNQT